ncbi:MAG: hypothetical protein ACM3MK_08695 [Chitinophagales bacterium]
MNVGVILIGNRAESAVQVQTILTKNGDMIGTRLGLNRQVGSNEDASGFIFMELSGDNQRINGLMTELNKVHNVTAQTMEVQLPDRSCLD